MMRGLLWVSPFCFMVSRMPFCPNRIIPQSYREHMAVLKLVCADTRGDRAYGLFVAFSVVGFDIIVISVSYVIILRTALGYPQVKPSSRLLAHVPPISVSSWLFISQPSLLTSPTTLDIMCPE